MEDEEFQDITKVTIEFTRHYLLEMGILERRAVDNQIDTSTVDNQIDTSTVDNEQMDTST